VLAPARIDWRWALAADSTEYSDSQALYRLQSADDLTKSAYLFKRAADEGLDTSRWPDIAAAYELHTNRPGERLFVEGLLLAEGIDEYIADLNGCAPEDIRAYHDLFFDVRPRVKQPGWVVSQLFQGSLYQSLNPRDRTAQLHRVAWLGGIEVFESFYTGRYDDSIREAMVLRIRDMMSKQTFLASGCSGGSGELNLELMRLYIDDTNKTIANTVAGGGKDKELGEAVMGFLSSMSLKVADPKDPANLALPAREPRASDYKAPIEVTDAVVKSNA
jgi:hypothetical protein